MDWKDYYPLDIINQWMYELERMYPATCTVSAIGKSVEGRTLLVSFHFISLYICLTKFFHVSAARQKANYSQ